MRSLSLIAALVIPAQLTLAQAAPSSARPGAGGTPLTLEDAITTARRNNPGFLQVQNTVRTAETGIRQTMAALLPSSSASFTTRYQQGGTQIFQGVALGGGSADSRQSQYNLGLNYNISGAIAFAPRSARASRNAAEADVTSQSEALRSQVTTQYIATLQAQAQAALQDTLVETATGQLDLANAKMKVGAGTILDVRTAEVAVGQAQVSALTAHNTAQIEKLKLFQLTGVPPDTGAALVTQFNVAPPDFALDTLLSLARRVNPDLTAKKSREYASELNIRSARTGYLPSLSIGTGWGGNSFEYVNPDLLVAQKSQQAAASQRS
ncbi:MAG TPA: TolC family protein, partial [Gemmatimonadaceae bacterium]|nr:TolC family protein [Gemmatimonadaceae bacterium]